MNRIAMIAEEMFHLFPQGREKRKEEKPTFKWKTRINSFNGRLRFERRRL
jgi:hypothetical protein